VSVPAGFKIDLRWTDFDAYGHVHLGAHVMLMDVGREKFLREQLGGLLSFDYFIVHAAVDIVGQITVADERVYCQVEVAELGTSSVNTSERLITEGGTVASTGSCVLVAWDRGRDERRPLSEKERRALGRKMAGG
jgi:acyl-CoA thioester hydrolase